MCDTMVATPEITKNGNMLFAKNSDREPNEAQALIRIPRTKHTAKQVQTTYIQIPQVRQTNEIILSKPFWMWGAEMGANEHGLVIGNEAVFTKVKFPKKNTGLTGMDMLRLTLERKQNARSAFEFLTSLISDYSQDACGGYQDKKFFYHNSFIIADAKEAFVLESAGHQWAAINVQGFRSISNGLTIECEYDYSSDHLIDFAKKKGWIKKGKDFNFREVYSESFLTYFSKGKARQANSMEAGKKCGNNLSANNMMSILRSHAGAKTGTKFRPSISGMDSLCLHASGITAPSQTTGSLVAEIRKKEPSTYWFTGSAAPCLSIFKPFFIPGKNLHSDSFIQPSESFDDSLWWRSEKLHRMALKNYEKVHGIMAKERDHLETAFQDHEQDHIKKSSNRVELNTFSNQCLDQADQAFVTWTNKAVLEYEKQKPFTPLYSLYRSRINKGVGL